MNTRKLVSRRQFLQAVEMGAAGVLLAACAPKAAPTAAPAATTAAKTAATPVKTDVEITWWSPNFGASTISNNVTGVEFMGNLMTKGGFKNKWSEGEWNEPVKHMAAIAAGNPPDCSFTGRHLTTDLAVRGAIHNLDDAVAKATTFKWTDIWTRLQKDALSWGKKWIIPYSTDTRAFFYNKTVLDEVGLKPPTTWEELHEACVKVTKKDSGGRLTRAGYTPTFGNPPVYLVFLTVLWCLDSDMITPDYSKIRILEKGEQAMEFLKKLMDAQGGYEQLGSFTKALTPATGLDAFSSGNVVMALHTNGVPPAYRKYITNFEWGMLPGPVFQGFKENANYDGGGGWLFFKKSKNFEASFKMVEHLMEKNNYLSYADLYNSLPARADVGEEWAKKNEADRRVFVNTANTVHWIPIFAGIMESLGYIQKAFDNILIGNKPIKAELETAQTACQKILDNFNAFTPPS